MTTHTFLNTEPARTNLVPQGSYGNHYPQSTPNTDWSLQWSLHQNMNPRPVAFGHVDMFAFASTVAGLLKLKRQHQERLAAVWLDETAQTLLSSLDQETSIRWEDLPDKADCDWSEASRSAALLVGANLCEVSPTRIRLNEYGDKLLAESSPIEEALPEVGS